MATGENLFAGAKVTASGHWSDREPALALGGKHNDAGQHWACENIPVWLAVELPQPRDLNAINLWTYWDGKRYYQYKIEASLDGQAWTLAVDETSNKTPATAEGRTFFFNSTKAKFVRVTFTHNSAGDKAGGHIVEIEGFSLKPEDVAALTAKRKAWDQVTAGLHGALGSTDVHYPRDTVPATDGAKAWSATGWRGERLIAQFVLWTGSGVGQMRLATTSLKDKAGNEIPAANVRARYVRYVLADKQLIPDVLDDAAVLEMPAKSARPIWLTVDVPADAKAGQYAGKLQVTAAGGATVSFDLAVKVLPLVLPQPAEWKFRLDLWQNPYSVARYHHVPVWSKEHWSLLEPVLRMAAEAGQKCLTTSIVHDPWVSQTYDPYDSMIEWVRKADGSWRYDYTIFDKYVEFGTKCGLTDSISCYSMVPWSNRFRYLNEATGDYAWVSAVPGTKEFEAHWSPFLKDFAAHLKERGWLERTAMAMDERPPEMMKPSIALVRTAAPGLRIALAGANTPELKNDIEDWCVFIDPALNPDIARERTAKGWPTTFYICCGPGKPNTFVFSPPAESAWMGWYAAAQDYTGLLRWAYNCWNEEPLYDTSYGPWPAGDCFLVYPGPRSSVHFERLREGIADYEKVRIARTMAAKQNNAETKQVLDRLNAAMKSFTYAEVQKTPAAAVVNPARKLLTELSEKLAQETK